MLKRLWHGLVHGGYELIFTRKLVVVTSWLLSCLSIALGLATLLSTQKHVQQVVLRYYDPSNTTSSSSSSSSGAYWEPQQHSLSVRMPTTLHSPVYAYYRVLDMYQNHKRYVRSVSWKQMSGDAGVQTDAPSCEPQRYASATDSPNASLPENGAILPCGLLPASLFNDTLDSITQVCPATSSGSSNGTQEAIQLDTTDVIWRTSLVSSLYGTSEATTNFNTLPDLRLGGTVNGTPGSSPQLIAWTQPNAKPDVLKPWAVIRQELREGCELRISISGQYNSSHWGGAKELVLVQGSWYSASHNLVLPIVLLVSGALLGLAPLVLLAVAAWGTHKLHSAT